MKQYCPKCGCEAGEGSLFCPNCGAPLNPVNVHEPIQTQERKNIKDETPVEVKEIESEKSPILTNENVSKETLSNAEDKALVQEAKQAKTKEEETLNIVEKPTHPTQSVDIKFDNNKLEKTPEYKKYMLIDTILNFGGWLVFGLLGLFIVFLPFYNLEGRWVSNLTGTIMFFGHHSGGLIDKNLGINMCFCSSLSLLFFAGGLAFFINGIINLFNSKRYINKMKDKYNKLSKKYDKVSIVLPIVMGIISVLLFGSLPFFLLFELAIIDLIIEHTSDLLQELSLVNPFMVVLNAFVVLAYGVLAGFSIYINRKVYNEAYKICRSAVINS